MAHDETKRVFDSRSARNMEDRKSQRGTRGRLQFIGKISLSFPRNPPFLAQAPCRIQQKFTFRTWVLKHQYSPFPRQDRAIPYRRAQRSSSLTPRIAGWGPAIRGVGMTGGEGRCNSLKGKGT